MSYDNSAAAIDVAMGQHIYHHLVLFQLILAVLWIHLAEEVLLLKYQLGQIIGHQEIVTFVRTIFFVSTAE